MKKIINKPETLVREMCSGLVLAHPELEFISKYKIVKKRAERGKGHLDQRRRKRP
ncbi:hypothetical protein [Paenibacillus thiaminolyticus]|uniref:hypothetical protein n=1 Tax=Paenibacillus thiaminolyticus TaxID=49283 RepID=UPI001FD123C3